MNLTSDAERRYTQLRAILVETRGRPDIRSVTLRRVAKAELRRLERLARIPRGRRK